MTRSISLRVVPAVALLMMGHALAAVAKGSGGCTNVSIEVTMYLNAGSTPMAIYGDGVDSSGVPLSQTTYTDKTRGVSALIKTCEPQFGVNAVVAASGTRKFNFNFSDGLDVSNSPFPNNQVLAGGWISVRDITFNSGGTYQPFTTRMLSSFTIQKTSYALSFSPESTDADAVDPQFTEVYQGDPVASPALVTPDLTAPLCPGGKPSQWRVEGLNNPQVGSLGDNGVLGHYSMPFRFVVKALSCNY